MRPTVLAAIAALTAIAMADHAGAQTITNCVHTTTGMRCTTTQPTQPAPWAIQPMPMPQPPGPPAPTTTRCTHTPQGMRCITN